MGLADVRRSVTQGCALGYRVAPRWGKAAKQNTLIFGLHQIPPISTLHRPSPTHNYQALLSGRLWIGNRFARHVTCPANSCTRIGTDDVIMAALQIACPKCGKSLKLPDRSLLGRKGKCSKCGHSFILEEPDEVQLELAEPAASQPPTGTSPRWVPDSGSPMQPPVTQQQLPPGYPAGMPPQWPAQMPYWGPPPYSGQPYGGQTYSGQPYPGAPYPGQAPMPQYPVPMAPNYGQPAAVPAMPVPSPPADSLPFEPEPPSDASPFAGFAESGPSALPTMDDEPPISASRYKPRQRRQITQAQITAAVIGLVLLVLVGSALAFRGSLFGSGKANSKALAKEGINPSNESDDSSWEPPLPIRPTKGDPLELFCMPYGVTAVVHLRPAELWQERSQGEEFRFCFGPLGEWLEKQIKEVCKYDPAQIEEVTFGLLPSVVGEPMQVAALVRLKERVQKTDLIKAFKGEYNETGGQYPVYLGEQYAYVIKDLQTFAVAPKLKQAEMAESVNRPNAQAPGLEALLKLTDRQRHLVVMFEPSMIGAHVQFVLPQELLPFADHFLEFFNSKQIETVAWSLHVGNEKFHSELLLRNKTSVTKTALQKQMKQKLDKLPHELADMIRGYMDPQTLGPRQIIGRFPAMMKVFSMATHTSSGDRYAALSTSLPERAAPNLAIGALLTWDESTRTNFKKSAATPDKPKETLTKLPDLVADRLKQLKVEIEFNRVPLQDCFKFISDECKVEIDIDGDGLKAAGYTKNMPQTMTLGKISGLEAVAAILQRYAKEKVPMVLVIQEDKKKALITTKEFAEKGNLTPAELPDVKMK